MFKGPIRLKFSGHASEKLATMGLCYLVIALSILVTIAQLHADVGF